MSNPYFAYSIKSEYVGGNGSSSDVSQRVDSPPVPEKPRKRNTSRACDVCSIRKTKCDNSRPCRSCVANNVKCTELRVRKKSGPKSLRKKTMDSISLVGADFAGMNADPGLLSSLDSSCQYPDLSAVVEALSGISRDFLQEAVPFTIPSIAEEAKPLLSYLRDCPHDPTNVQVSTMRYAMSTLALVLLELLSRVEKPAQYALLSRDLHIYILSARAACERLIVFDSAENLGFDAHFYLALGDLHQFSYLALKAVPSSHKWLHLHASMAHCDFLELKAEDSVYSKGELRRTLQIWMRQMTLFGADRVFRKGRILPLNFNYEEMLSTKNHALNTLYELLRVSDHLVEAGAVVPEPFSWSHHQTEFGDSNYTYAALKRNLDTVSETRILRRPGELVTTQILNLLIQFKLLLVTSHKYSESYVSDELMDIIVRVNMVLGEAGTQEKLLMEKFTLTTPLLEVLAAYLSITREEEFTPESLSALIQFTTIVSVYMSDRSRPFLEIPLLSGWFARFSSR
ncbi:hypothetical protein OXX79_007128 [Metschnikowia pulcherrima]